MGLDTQSGPTAHPEPVGAPTEPTERGGGGGMGPGPSTGVVEPRDGVSEAPIPTAPAAGEDGEPPSPGAP